jgi:hypothetical protein
MKKLLLLSFVFGVIAFGGVSASAQCDPNVQGSIKCSYYNEGYQDGSNDARNNRSSDYKRYRDKYEKKYEDFFRDGYNAGYESVRPTTRWTSSQRNAYDSGYSIGQSDRRSGTYNRPTENYRGYDSNISAYFQQGYDDGYNNRSRQYDVPLGNTPPTYPPTYPPYPGQGNSTGTAYWNGRVDDRANIIIRGSTIYAENVSGNQTTTTSQNISGALPRRATTVSVRKVDGRGGVNVIQQPNRLNNFTAIVQIYDPKGGARDYKIEASWAGAANVEEPYRSGSISWRGRVDQTANIVISGSDVQSQDASGTGLWSVSQNINGYLARRPGTVNASKRRGRGTVTILQQPNWENDFTAIIQVFDPNGGADNYEVDISW